MNRVYADIYREFLRFQLMRSHIRKRFSAGALGITEIHILLHLDALSSVYGSELAVYLNVNKSTVTKALKKLISSGIVSSVINAKDRRSRNLCLTKRGNELISELDLSQVQVVKESLEGLNINEQGDFCSYLKHLADGFFATDFPSRPQDHQLTIQIRRLNRVLGVVGSDFLETSYSLPQHHILWLMKDRASPVMLSDIFKHLPFHKSLVSRAVKKLELSGLLERSKDSCKKRRFTLTLTACGNDILEDLQINCGGRMQKALISLSLREVNKFSKLLKRVANRDSREKLKIAGVKLEVREIKTKHNCKLARGQYIEHLVKHKLHFNAASEMFSANEINFGLYKNQDMVSAVSFKKEDYNLRLNCFWIKEGFECISEEFLKESCKLLYIKKPKNAVIIE